MIGGQHTIPFGSTEIAFTLTRSSRQRIKITVGPDRQIAVEAPADRELAEILN